MQVVLLRVGIDTGSGGIHGPLFSDGSFEFVPIPDGFGGRGVDNRTYGNSQGRNGRAFVEYFPPSRRERMSNQPIHFDPEFETFTYGDPTPPKASLRRLTEGSLLVFYAGLKGQDFDCPPALYIVGYFVVDRAGLVESYTQTELATLFGHNFHVMHGDVFENQRDRLVLVKGKPSSKLLQKAVRISVVGENKNGRPLHRLGPEMQQIFGDFDGRTSIQRCPPRWTAEQLTERASDFVLSLK